MSGGAPLPAVFCVTRPLAPYFVGYNAADNCQTYYADGTIKRVPSCPYAVGSLEIRGWFIGVTDSASDRILPPPARLVHDARHS